MKYYKKLVGKNVYLSPVSEEDAERYMEWMNDFNVTDYIGRSSSIVTLPGEKEWITEATNGKKIVFSIIKLENDELIGNIELMNYKVSDRRATLGILIGSDNNRSKGFGTESINLLLDFAFNYMNLHSVELTVLDDNIRAQKCYHKVGFKDVGRERQARYLNGKYHDEIVMDILREEFTGDFMQNKNI